MRFWRVIFLRTRSRRVSFKVWGGQWVCPPTFPPPAPWHFWPMSPYSHPLQIWVSSVATWCSGLQYHSRLAWPKWLGHDPGQPLWLPGLCWEQPKKPNQPTNKGCLVTDPSQFKHWLHTVILCGRILHNKTQQLLVKHCMNIILGVAGALCSMLQRH